MGNETMNKNIENINRYLKAVVLPEHTSHQHRQQLRREVLEEIERKQTMSVRVRSWKVAAVIAVVIGAGALATTVGLKVRKLYFRGTEPDGTYIFSTEPETVDTGDGRTLTRMRMVKSKLNPNQTVEQKIKDLEEVELLRQQDTSRELLSVVETEVKGELQPRTFRFKYTLADGREITIGEGDPDTQDRQRSLTEAQEEELTSLLRTDEYVTIGFEKKEFRGRMFSFERNRFVLSDGTEVIWSVGRPSEDSQSEVKTIVKDAKEAEQILNDKREIAILRQQDKRQLIGIDELVANGKLDRRVLVYQYQLSDGRTKDLREGTGGNYILNSKQRQEWIQSRDAGSGENLDTYEEKVEGRIFVFKRHRFVLGDGTEIIWSPGTLKDGQ